MFFVCFASMWKQSRRDLGYTVVVQWLINVLLFRSHGLQHARPPCPSPSHRACSNSCPLSQWCHPTISSSVIPFSPFLQSFPASGSFLINQFITTGGPSNGASISASELPKKYSGLISFRIDCFDLLAFIQRNSRKVSPLLLFPSQQVTKKILFTDFLSLYMFHESVFYLKMWKSKFSDSSSWINTGLNKGISTEWMVQISMCTYKFCQSLNLT